jgi:hypothetical protein
MTTSRRRERLVRTPVSALPDDPSPESILAIGGTASTPIARSRRFIATLTLVTAFVIAAALPAQAGLNADSLSLVLLDSDAVPNWGEQVTFDVTTTAARPFVNVRCYQGEAFVYDGWAGFFDDAWFGQTFTLSSTYWQGGAADCKARLVRFTRNGRERVLARMGFHVYP